MEELIAMKSQLISTRVELICPPKQEEFVASTFPSPLLEESKYFVSDDEDPYEPDATDDEYRPSDSEIISTEEKSTPEKAYVARKGVVRQLFEQQEEQEQQYNAPDLQAETTVGRVIITEDLVELKLKHKLHVGQQKISVQMSSVGNERHGLVKMTVSPHECVSDKSNICVITWEDSTVVFLENKSCLLVGSYKGQSFRMSTGTTVAQLVKGQLRTLGKKTHYCLFCQKQYIEVRSHLKTIHKDEFRVKEAIEISDRIEKRRAFQAIVNEGDRKVEKDHSPSKRVPVRKSSKTSITEYVQCTNCFGRLAPRNFARHDRLCTGRLPNCKRVITQAKRSENLKSRTVSDIAKCKVNLLNVLRDDEIKDIIMTDGALQLYAEQFAVISHFNDTKGKNTRNELRMLARLLQIIQEIDIEVFDYFDVLNPHKYEVLICAIMTFSGVDIGNKEISKTAICTKFRSIFTNLGHCVLTHLRMNPNVLEGGQEGIKKVNDFLAVHEKQYSDKLSKVAVWIRARTRLLNARDPPSIADISLFTTYLEKIANEAAEKLENEPFDVRVWSTLGNAALIMIMTFNRRRIGETSRLSLKLYRGRTKVNEDDMKHLSRLEAMLANKFSIMKLVGKKVRFLTILLSEKHIRYLDLLIKFRPDAKIPETNEYLFADNSTTGYIYAANALRKYAIECGAKNPNSLRATLLRRQIATCSQLLQLSHNEIRQIADFMGHDMEVHLRSYRTAEAVQQVTVLSKFLMAVGDTDLSRFKGKTLAELDVIAENDNVNDNDDVHLPSWVAALDPDVPVIDRTDTPPEPLVLDDLTVATDDVMHDPTCIVIEKAEDALDPSVETQNVETDLSSHHYASKNTKGTAVTTTPTKSPAKSTRWPTPKKLPFSKEERNLLNEKYKYYISQGLYPPNATETYSRLLSEHSNVFHKKRSVASIYSYVQYRVKKNKNRFR